MSTSEAMMDDLRTDLCELGFMELIDYVHEFLRPTVANMIAIKQLNRMWRFIAMMAAHWEGAILCKCGKHMLLNPTKLQKPIAEKDAWCCDSYTCKDFCTCNIPKCLKDDDELQDQRIGGYPAFEFLAIDFALPHEYELCVEVVDVFRRCQPNIDNVYFDSWPQDNVVAIRFLYGSHPNKDQEINNKLLELFGPRNLRLFVVANAPISSTALEQCCKLKWLDLRNVGDRAGKETLSAVMKLPQLKRLSVDRSYSAAEGSIELLRDNTSIENLSLRCMANDAIVEEASWMKSLSSLTLNGNSCVSTSAIKSLVANGTRLEELSVYGCSKIAAAAVSAIANISTLRSLDVMGCDIKDSNIEELVAKLPQLEVLKLTCDDIHDNGLAALANLSSLRSLTWIVPETATPDAFNAALGNLMQLQVLDLEGSGVKSEHLQFLEKLRSLEVLSLERCDNIDDEGLSHLQCLAKLRKLNLCFCHRITSDGIAHLSQLTEMESLKLNFTSIDNTALQHISGLTKMRWLTIHGCEHITKEGLTHLRGMRELEFLCLAECNKFTRRAAPMLMRCTEKASKLKYLCHRCGVGENEGILKRFPHLRVVLNL